MSRKYFLLTFTLLLLALGVSKIPWSKAYFRDQVVIGGNVLATSYINFEASESATPSATPQGTLETTQEVLIQNDSANLYNLMSTDFQQTFTKEDLKAGFNGNEEIESIEYLETPQSLGDGWYEQKARVHTKSGRTDTFNFILKQENGLWRLYATEELHP